jgi:hypothetical protein
MTDHLRRWGAAYLLAGLFLGSWAGQLWASWGEIRHGGWQVFWSATFENWQSEWLQLFVQAVVLLALKHVLFAADAEDMEALQESVNALEGRLERIEGLLRQPRQSGVQLPPEPLS